MTTFASGARGHIVIPAGAGAQSTGFRRWSASFERDMADATVFDNQDNAERNLGLMHDCKATAEGIADDAVTPILTHMQTVDAEPVAGFVLAAVKGTPSVSNPHKGWSFAGLVTEMTIDAPKLAEQTISIGFESSDTIDQDPTS